MRSLTVQEVADRYGVSQHVILYWIRTHELSAVNVCRRAGAKRPTWRITEQALAEFEARRTPTPTAPRRRKAKAEGVVAFY
jgi:excisionase family DNA binding protein